MKNILLSFFFFVVINNSFVISSRIKIEKNGYHDILIVLPSKIIPEKRSLLVTTVKNLFQHSSVILQNATKGRANFHSVSFLVPNDWGDIDVWFPNRDKTIAFEEPNAALNREEADIIITDPDDEVHPYTLHHQGCGKQSHRIYLPANFSTSGNLHDRSVEFVRLWSEFRYGVFPEGGFEDDGRFPPTYRSPKDEINQETGCVNTPFRVPIECEVPWNCNGSRLIPSIMDQHFTNGTYFCEGHTSLGQIHNPDAPSKQNLFCNEEGTYYTLLRSPDFKYGKNAAPRRRSQREISFRYIKESSSARIFVAIDITSQMKNKNMFAEVKNAFSRFVYHDLPSGSSLSLFVFGGDESMTLLTDERLIDDIESRIRYLESQPLPDEPVGSENSCPECALNDILEHIRNNSIPAPHVVLITTKFYLDATMYQNLVEELKRSEMRLHIFMLSSTPTTHSNNRLTWYSLCKETGNVFIFIEHDHLGNLYSSFSNIVQSAKSVRIAQEYLTTLDEEVLHFSIPVDESISQSLIVSLTGPSFDSNPLKYDSTVLKDPDNISFYPQKQELLPAWIFNVSNPKTGKYSMRTLRKRRATSPILITATAQSSEKDHPIIARVWTETLETGTKFSQPPLIIFGEVRKEPYPVMNATVKAFVHHPNNDGVSEVDLLDDGLGNADITKHDGIYSRYFTNFTSIGFYTIRIKVMGDMDTSTAVRKGPSSSCCGSFLPSDQQTSIAEIAREAGPITFEVTSVPKYDPYPPSKVTDLSITRSFDDKLFVLQWTAVGSDYDRGVASTYEIKLFRDRSLVKNRFFDSGLEVYNVTVETTEEASYGTQLYHTLTITQMFEKGLYYIGIRAVDSADNYGEPSNVVSIFLNSKTSSKHIECAAGRPEALKLNSALEIQFSYTLFFSLFIIYILKIVVCWF